MKRILRDTLDRAFRIRPEEQRTVLLMFLYSACTVSVVGRTAAAALFLKRVDKAYLPYMYIAVAVFLALLSALMTWSTGRLRSDRMMKIVSLSLGTIILGLRGFLALSPDSLLLVGSLYVVAELTGELLIINLWAMANELFTPRQAKRVFAFIAGGSTLSFVVFSAVVTATVGLVGAQNLLFLMAALVLMCLVPTHYLGKAHAAKLEDSSARARAPAVRRRLAPEDSPFSILRTGRMQLVSAIAATVVCTTLVVELIDYQWKVVVQASYAPDETALAAYFSRFYLLAGLIQVVFQFALARRVLQRWGLLVGLSALPGVLFATSGAVLAASSAKRLLSATTAAKAADMILRYTIHSTSVQILYLPVPAELRSRAKFIIDGIVRPCATGVTGLLILAMIQVLHEKNLSLAALVGLLAWVGLVPYTLAQYKTSLADSTRKRKVVLSGAELVLDDATRRTLVSSLEGADEEAAHSAMEVIESFPETNWDPHVSKRLEAKAAGLRMAAVRHLGREGNTAYAPAIARCMTDPDPEVRSAAISCYSTLGEPDVVEALTGFLGDPAADIKSAAIAGIIRHRGMAGVLATGSELNMMLQSDDWRMRLGAAQAIGALGIEALWEPLLPLLDDAQPRVRNGALRAAAQIHSRDLLPRLLELLVDRTTARTAVSALAGYGDDVADTLADALADRETPHRARALIPRVLARIGTQRCLDVLLRFLRDDDEDLRLRVYTAIGRVMDSDARLHVPAEAVVSACKAEIRQYFQHLGALLELGDRAHPMLLGDALRHQMDRARERTLQLLAILYPWQGVELVAHALHSSLRETRANALELLDNIVYGDYKPALIAMLDDEPLAQKYAAAARLYLDLPRKRAEDWIASLLEDENPWVVACAVFEVAEAGESGRARVLETKLKSDDALVRETADFSLRKLAGATKRAPEAS